MQVILGAGSIYAIGTVAPTLVAVCITPFVTRSLSPSDYALVATYILVVQVAQVGWTFGLPASITRRVGLSESDASVAWVNAARLGMITTFASLFLAAAVLTVTKTALGQVLALSLVGSACLAVFTATQSILRALCEVRTFVAQSVALSAFGPILGLLLLSQSDEVMGYVLALFLNQAIVTIVASAAIRRKVSPLPGFSLAAFTSDVRIGMPTIPHQWATVAVVPLIAFAASSFGPSAVGEAQLSLLLGTGPVLLLSAFNNAWATQYYRVPARVQPQFLAKTTALMVYFSVTLALFTTAIAPWLIAILAGPDMDRVGMTAQVRVAAGAAGVYVIYLANLHPLVAVGRTNSLYWRAPMNLSIAMTLLAFVVYLHGPKPLLAIGYVVFIALQAWGMSRARASAWSEHLSLRPQWFVAIGGFFVCAAAAASYPCEPLTAIIVMCLSATVAIGGAVHVHRLSF